MVDSKKDTVKEHKGTLKVSAATCPRCLVDFVCNAADIKQCQCYGVNLQVEDISYLRKHGFSAEQSGCLCRNCLLAVKEAVKNS